MLCLLHILQLRPKTCWQRTQKLSMFGFFWYINSCKFKSINLNQFKSLLQNWNLNLWRKFYRGIVPDNITDELQKLISKLLKTRYLSQGNNLSTNSMPYFQNFVSISLKVNRISLDKLLFWYIKFAVLITTILHPTISFESEIDSNGYFFRSSHETVMMHNVIKDHAIINFFMLNILVSFWTVFAKVFQI